MRTSLALTLLAAALALPAAAAAKGPSHASLAGPGIDGRETIPGDGESGPGTPLGALVTGGGFFPQMFGAGPGSTTTASRPPGRLGPRYTVTYVVPGPNGDSVVRQDLYPYATPSPVTFMAPGQAFWDGQATAGGWYVAPGPLRATLGLPADAPSPGGGSRVWHRAATGAPALALLLAGAWLALRRGRRTSPKSPAEEAPGA